MRIINLSDLKKDQNNFNIYHPQIKFEEYEDQYLYSDLFSLIAHRTPDINSNILSLEKKRQNINDYLNLMENIHNILLDCKNLTNQQMLELCKRQRDHMKSYLREIVVKLYPHRKIKYIES